MPVVCAAEEPGRLRAVEHQAINGDVLLVRRFPLMETYLKKSCSKRKYLLCAGIYILTVSLSPGEGGGGRGLILKKNIRPGKNLEGRIGEKGGKGKQRGKRGDNFFLVAIMYNPDCVT